MPRSTVHRSRIPRGLLLPILGAIALAGVMLLLFISRDGDSNPSTAPAEPPAPGESNLALRFAPVYQLRIQERECDRRGEPYVPSPVEIVLGQAGVRLHQSPLPVLEQPVAADLEGPAENSFLDYPGDPRKPGCRYERDARRIGESLTPTVYARVVTEPGVPGLAIQYWSFYYFNDWNNKHEGDWEMVQVIFDADTVEEAAAKGPDYVVYAQHGGGERAGWDSKKLQKSGEHPVVFVSAGSHASYFSPNTYLGLGEPGTGLGCDVAMPPHWLLEPRIVTFQEAEGDGSQPDAWLKFQGRWGQVISGEFNGPTGPQTKTSWKFPLTWAGNARAGSATLPGSDFFGVDAVHSFCDTVEAGSLLLRTYLRFPLLVGGAAALVLGAIAIIALIVLRDMARSPMVGHETAGFLRHRRSLGQMIRAAFIVYARFPRLFLGIAFAFIPVSIVLALLQGWLLSVPPLDRLHWLLNANQVSHLLLGLLVGGLASFAVYLFVVSGAVAAVRLIDAGAHPGIRESYRNAMLGAPGVLLARGRTLLALGLLGFSIVGLPVAVWLAVRWYFVEEAVLLDHESQWRAPGTSSRLVSGQWFRALGRVLSFGVLGALAGPVFAVTALVATDANPALVNVLAGFLHMAVLPFAAVGLCLAYCDLQVRAEERPIPAATPPSSLPWPARAVRRVAAAVLHLFEGRRRGR